MFFLRAKLSRYIIIGGCGYNPKDNYKIRALMCLISAVFLHFNGYFRIFFFNFKIHKKIFGILQPLPETSGTVFKISDGSRKSRILGSPALRSKCLKPCLHNRVMVSHFVQCFSRTTVTTYCGTTFGTCTKQMQMVNCTRPN